MEIGQQISTPTSPSIEASSAPATENVQSEDNTLLFVILGIAVIYWYHKSTQKKTLDFIEKHTKRNPKILDSYSKFINTPYGTRFESSFLRKRVKPTVYQIMEIDRFLQRLSQKQHEVLRKASQFELRKDIERALTEKEILVYLPIRKKLLEISESIIK